MGLFEVISSDFAAFNKAIDDLIATGMSEDEAIDNVASEWKFEGLNL